MLPGGNDKPYGRCTTMLGVKLNFKGKSPLAALTCESTQPTLDATT